MAGFAGSESASATQKPVFPASKSVVTCMAGFALDGHLIWPQSDAQNPVESIDL
jgi:hypothetical protein